MTDSKCHVPRVRSNDYAAYPRFRRAAVFPIDMPFKLYDTVPFIPFFIRCPVHHEPRVYDNARSAERPHGRVSPAFLRDLPIFLFFSFFSSRSSATALLETATFPLFCLRSDERGTPATCRSERVSRPVGEHRRALPPPVGREARICWAFTLTFALQIKYWPP